MALTSWGSSRPTVTAAQQPCIPCLHERADVAARDGITHHHQDVVPLPQLMVQGCLSPQSLLCTTLQPRAIPTVHQQSTKLTLNVTASGAEDSGSDDDGGSNLPDVEYVANAADMYGYTNPLRQRALRLSLIIWAITVHTKATAAPNKQSVTQTYLPPHV